MGAEALLDLGGQLPGGRKDERARPAGERGGALKTGEQRKPEGERLSGARRGLSQDGMTVEDIGDAGGLDGEGLAETHRVKAVA